MQLRYLSEFTCTPQVNQNSFETYTRSTKLFNDCNILNRILNRNVFRYSML